MRIGVSAVVVAAALLFSGNLASTAAAQTTSTSPTPQDVVDAFELARGAGDVDGALAQLADTAVITVENRTSTRSYTGSVQLRTYLQSIGTRFQTMMRSRPLVEGTSVTWTERDMVGTLAVDATVVAIVSAGRIVALSYRDNEVSGAPALEQLTEPKPLQLPNFAWAAALAGFGVFALGLVFAWPRRKASHSELDGRLLIALQRERDHRERGAKKAA